MTNKAAFTLVELSIVLVILGLLVGGVLAGQNLIRAAELRSVITEFNQHQTAVMTFKEKYFALPGDMDNATAFWGTDSDGCPTHANFVTKQETCDGDGDGKVGETPRHEVYRFWQHLANAGLTEGTFTGVTGASTAFDSVIGINVPSSALSGAGWTASNRANYAGDAATWYELDFANMLIAGKQSTGEWTNGRIFSTEEAWGIDTKTDDGFPGRGKVIGLHFTTCSDATTDTAYDEPYDLDYSGEACALAFVRAF